MNAPETVALSPMPHVMNTYGRLPIALSHGQGCWVWDTRSKRKPVKWVWISTT